MFGTWGIVFKYLGMFGSLKNQGYQGWREDELIQTEKEKTKAPLA